MMNYAEIMVILMTYDDEPIGFKECFMCGRVRSEGLFIGVPCSNPTASSVKNDGKRYFCDICQKIHNLLTLRQVAGDPSLLNQE